jgi:hypothetical protein
MKTAVRSRTWIPCRANMLSTFSSPWWVIICPLSGRFKLVTFRCVTALKSLSRQIAGKIFCYDPVPARIFKQLQCHRQPWICKHRPTKTYSPSGSSWSLLGTILPFYHTLLVQFRINFFVSRNLPYLKSCIICARSPVLLSEEHAVSQVHKCVLCWA